jgi:predicted Zn-dependent peptidase
MYKQTKLKNGLKILAVPMPNTRSVTILALVGAGSKYERKDKNGLSHFLEHMYFKGTKKRPKAIDISREIDGVGGIINAFTGKDFTGYYVKVDYPHYEMALDVVADIFLNSTLKQQEIERERGVIIEEIKMSEDAPFEYIENIWEKVLYGDQPAGWDIAGTRKTIATIKRQDFIKYINNFYVASNTVLVVAGHIKEKDIIPKVKKYFKKANSKKALAKKKVQENQLKPSKLYFKKDTQQTHLAVGVRGFNSFDDKRYALQVLANILGGNMSSRLFQELREKRGLAYYVGTRVEVNPDTGYLTTFSGIDHKNIQLVVDLILKEYNKIARQGPNEIEIKHAKEYIKGILRLSLEESDNIASFYGMQALMEKSISTPEEKIKNIEKVTKQNIINTAREIFVDKNLNVAAICPKEEQLKKFFFPK